MFKATESEDRDILKLGLKAAIAYFEESSQNGKNYSLVKFCLPLYRTYLAIALQEGKEDDIQKYLAEAKEAVGRSKSKEGLFKAIDNLAKALQESRKLKERPLHEIASELNAYGWYCDQAARYMDAAEESAPDAIKLMRKCNPLSKSEYSQ